MTVIVKGLVGCVMWGKGLVPNCSFKKSKGNERHSSPVAVFIFL